MGLWVAQLQAVGADIDPYMIFTKIQQAYSGAGYISFNMHYKYAAKATPAILTDSLEGRAVIHGNNYYVVLDNVENMANDRHVFQVFPKESVIVLSNRTAANQSNAALPGMLPDTAMIRKNGLLLTAVENGKNYQLTITFPARHTYKKITLLVAANSGYIQKAIYEVASDALANGEIAKQEGGNQQSGLSGEDALVTVLYSDYSTAAIDESIFTDERFVVQENTEKKPASKYAGYTIYNTNPK
ncbi:hypothetical protein FLA_4168 [Filimonas lacunae]|nr:hypothetical protein FLA_4168 [Filimonas lacunae]